MPGPTPSLSAMLVCDTIIRDQRTGRCSIINIFNHIRGRLVPVHMARLAVYAGFFELEVDAFEPFAFADLQAALHRTAALAVAAEETAHQDAARGHGIGAGA